MHKQSIIGAVEYLPIVAFNIVDLPFRLAPFGGIIQGNHHPQKAAVTSCKTLYGQVSPKKCFAAANEPQFMRQLFNFSLIQLMHVVNCLFSVVWMYIIDESLAKKLIDFASEKFPHPSVGKGNRPLIGISHKNACLGHPHNGPQLLMHVPHGTPVYSQVTRHGRLLPSGNPTPRAKIRVETSTHNPDSVQEHPRDRK